MQNGAPHIVLDPGHGGRDPGAVSGGGLKEKDVNLAVAQELTALLLATGAVVTVTRTSDDYVAIKDRLAMANASGADFLISIHCNGFSNPAAHGTETFHYASSRTGKLLAEKLQAAMRKALGRRDRGVKTANFAMLRLAAMPAALVELMFITNPQEELLLRTPCMAECAAKALFRGFQEFMATRTEG